MNTYHAQISDYYRKTEKHYRDYWGMGQTLALHYGYWDEKVKTFEQSLLRMNEVLAETARIGPNDRVLDAGCGVGGSSIYMASTFGCHATGITLSDRQMELAFEHARQRGVSDKTDFKVMNYCKTDFPDQSFDVVWGCESICHADDKEQFVREAFRLLKPGGRLILADFMVPRFECNQETPVRNWLDGWSINFLETPERFRTYMNNAGFAEIKFRDVTAHMMHSTKRLRRLYFLGKLYLMASALVGRKMDPVRQRNLVSSRYQYECKKRNLWTYGMFLATKA